LITFCFVKAKTTVRTATHRIRKTKNGRRRKTIHAGLAINTISESRQCQRDQ
jgi:hypothetical protein